MSGLFHNIQRTCVVICTPIPCRLAGGVPVLEPVSARFHRARMALQMPTNFNTAEYHADGMEVGVARSLVAKEVLAHEPTPEFVFFIDYDVLVPPDALTKLVYRARCFPQHDVYAGVYCLKAHEPPEPLIYGEHGQGPVWNWTVGDLITTESHGVRSVHMGLTLIRSRAFRRIKDAGLVDGDGGGMTRPFFKTTYEHTASGRHEGTEDIWFCDLLTKAGGTILVDTGVLAGHEDRATGKVWGLSYEQYGPVGRAKWMPRPDGSRADEAEAEVDGLKLALDLGAGGQRREWPGHKTYTTDVRADANPDYVQDTRMLTLPDDHFDLVASAHHLEHIPRFEQERVFREMARITKPGGRWEHVLPSVEWAAHKIIDNELDAHVLNVLYGSQDMGGFEREYNLHFFAYTKVLAEALARQAGMVDVEVTDWRDDPEKLYEMSLRARKPLPEEVTGGSAEGAGGVCVAGDCTPETAGGCRSP